MRQASHVSRMEKLYFVGKPKGRGMNSLQLVHPH